MSLTTSDKAHNLLMARARDFVRNAKRQGKISEQIDNLKEQWENIEITNREIITDVINDGHSTDEFAAACRLAEVEK